MVETFPRYLVIGIVLSHYDVAMTSQLNKIDYLLAIYFYAEKLYLFANGKLV